MSAKRDNSSWTSDKRYVRRDNDGRFRESDDVGRSLSADRRDGRTAKDSKTAAGSALSQKEKSKK